MKRWEWNRSEVQGVVIYCPWLIHSKCVEPRTGKREWELGYWEGWSEGMQTVGSLSMHAGSLSAVTSPPALSPDRFIRTITHTHTLIHTHTHIRKIIVTLQLLNCFSSFPLTYILFHDKENTTSVA